MSLLNRKEPLVLFLGDLSSFVAALWLSLLIRGLEVPSKDLLLTHLLPFSLLFALWILVFYIAGLYEKHTVILKSKLPSALASTQIINSTLAVVFFYFIPFFGITPKTILFIYLLVSFVLVLSWRMYGYFRISRGHPDNAILIGSGDALKRLMDIVISIPLLLIPILLYPFVFIAVRLDDRGPIFTYQDRVGRNNHIIRILKFRTMIFNDNGDWQSKGLVNKVTAVGSFLRKTRLDEFPQLWNVLKGDISLIGPRPEFPEAVKHYTDEIPYYNVRHLIKPGLSGWAQIYQEEHPHHGVDTFETTNKLSYDLYYIKNRSFLLDIKIALRTLKILVSIAGR